MSRVLLISTYEMGRQPFGLASPAAWLREAGAEVRCLDLAVEPFDGAAVEWADLVAFFLPMHLATRLAVDALARVRQANAAAHVCCYGLYAPTNAEHLRSIGVDTVIGGEFEQALVDLALGLAASPSANLSPSPKPLIRLDRLDFRVPDRSPLPPLERYARVVLPDGERRTAGYTEASRGCKHRCRHCPIVPVYDGRFRIVRREVVLEDIRRQVAAGARHITFGDPDFFNGIGHALPLVTALQREFPDLTYDVTIKIEHLLRHAEHLRTLAETGCLFVTSAVESFDDRVLALLEKGHTRAHVERVLELTGDAGLVLVPTFVAFTPWITLDGYRAFLSELARLGLVERVAPIQYAIRLLIPPGSRLLELAEVRAVIEELDAANFVWRWRHPDPRVDELQRDVQALVHEATWRRASRREVFEEVWRHAHARRAEAATACGDAAAPALPLLPARASVPFLTEPWFC
ncbi:MAG: radical SAM protein [Gemmatimonadetes bacterium]|nr:radical SAM protein [Gemmatimonadota bacterium]